MDHANSIHHALSGPSGNLHSQIAHILARVVQTDYYVALRDVQIQVLDYSR